MSTDVIDSLRTVYLDSLMNTSHAGQDTLESLERSGLAESSSRKLSAAGRAKLRVVLSGGVFDIIHPGHIHTLRQARLLGDVLVIVVATDATALKMKKRAPLHTQEQRHDLVMSLSMVDACVIGREGDMFHTVSSILPDIIALGYDQAHQENYVKDGCKRVGVNAKVMRLDAIDPEISSSAIEKAYGDTIHGI